MSMRQMFVCLLPCALFLAARAAIAGPGCETISGFDQYLSRARGVIVADMHGTVEAPAFVGALVCNLVHSGHAVVLGLEYPSAEQHFIEEYLRARTDNPQRALLSTPFWIRPMQDGRTSRGMLDLLYSVRQEIHGGAQIRVVAFDSLPAPALSGTAAFNARDEAMADRLRHALSNLGAEEIPVVFTGNVHARKTKGLQALNAPPGMENAEPLGYRLRDLGFLYMDIDYRGGSAWTCAAHCGVLQVGRPGAGVSSFSIVPSANPAYDVQYSVGALTASPPAATAK
jgi:erythromycin esterase-like protein